MVYGAEHIWRRRIGAKDLAKITFTAKMTTSIVSGQPVVIEERFSRYRVKSA